MKKNILFSIKSHGDQVELFALIDQPLPRVKFDIASALRDALVNTDLDSIKRKITSAGGKQVESAISPLGGDKYILKVTFTLREQDFKTFDQRHPKRILTPPTTVQSKPTLKPVHGASVLEPLAHKIVNRMNETVHGMAYLKTGQTYRGGVFSFVVSPSNQGHTEEQNRRLKIAYHILEEFGCKEAKGGDHVNRDDDHIASTLYYYLPGYPKKK